MLPYETLLAWAYKNKVDQMKLLTALSLPKPFMQPIVTAESVPDLSSVVRFLSQTKKPLMYYVAAAFDLDLWDGCPDIYQEQIKQYIFNTQNWTKETWDTFLKQLYPDDAALWSTFLAHANDIQWFYAYFDVNKLAASSDKIKEDLLATAYNKFKIYSTTDDPELMREARAWGQFILKILKEFDKGGDDKVLIELLYRDE